MKKIIVVGSINTDLVINTPYMPKRGETVTGGGFFTAHGGKGSNQAVACALLGGNVVMCGCVGDDDFGKTAVKSISEAGVDVSAIRVASDMPTGTAVIVISESDNRIILDKGANGCLTESDIDSVLETASVGDIYLTQLENPIDVIGYGLKTAHEKGLYTVLNPAPANIEILPYLRYCDLIIPNESECEILGGKSELEKCVCTLIVTLGSKGYLIYENGKERKYPCIKVHAVDTTAAGDTFCGGLCARLAAGEVLESAAAFGSLAASIACTKNGAQCSIPTLRELAPYSD